MAEGRVTRKLAAILAGDVVGFSRLMSADEVGALAQVTAHLDEVVGPAVEAHRGHIFKTMGDGFLAEFASAVEAVECAVRIQRAMAERAGGVAEEHRAIFRIGINLGDVIVQGDDVFGDGVNVAARIEALADPGGVFISHSVCDQITGKCNFPLEDVGEHQVKNIPKPVHVFRVVTDPSAAPRKRLVPAPGKNKKKNQWLTGLVTLVIFAALGAVAAGWFRVPEVGTEVERVVALSEVPSIAVLPLINLSDDPEQEYFADGMSEDLITDLSKISGLMVISRTSSFAYKGKSEDVRDIARALNSQYVVEGSVRRANNKIRINLQLIDAKTGHHVWAERYDNTIEEVFAIQDLMTEQLVKALESQLETVNFVVVSKRKTIDLKAYDAFLQGSRIFQQFSKDDTFLARRYFEEAIELDPEFARAYSMLAWTHVFEYTNGWATTPQTTLQLGLDIANKSISLDSNSPVAHFVRGLVNRERGEFEEALIDGKKSIELEPSYANGYVLTATLLYYAGKPEEGLNMLDFASRLNPLHPSNYPFHRGQALFILKRYKEAIEAFKFGLSQNPTSQRLRVWLAVTYAQVGLLEDAEWEASEILNDDPSFSPAHLESIFPFQNSEDLKTFNSALNKAGFRSLSNKLDN